LVIGFVSRKVCIGVLSLRQQKHANPLRSFYGLLRLSRFSQAYLNRIALRLNQRPRKTLGFETPADRLQAELQ